MKCQTCRHYQSYQVVGIDYRTGQAFSASERGCIWCQTPGVCGRYQGREMRDER